MRMTIGAGIVAIYAALTATELWSERRRTLQKRWPAIVVPVLHGFVLMLPILLGDLLHPHDDKFSSSIWVTVFSDRTRALCGRHRVRHLHAGVRAHGDRAQDGRSMDPLTGMFNRRGFAEATSRVIEREANAGRPVTVLIFDIDHFKSINDRFGHPAGDEILKLFAAVVVNSLRIIDLSGRIGGEEFAALLPCSLEEGVVAAERVREAFANSGIVVEAWPGRYHRQHRRGRRAGGHRARGAAGGGRYRALSGQAQRPQSRRGGGGAAAVAGKLAAKDRRHSRVSRSRGRSLPRLA